MESERARRIDETIANVVSMAVKQHESPARVAGVLATALQTVVSSVVEELGELEQRVRALEELVDFEGTD